MKTMDFVVRPVMGATRRGVVEADADMSVIRVAAGEEISFNIRQSDLASYVRVGSDLQITLSDGRVVMLQDYFSNSGPAPRFFISADGYLSEVVLVQGSDGVLYAQYGPTEAWGKWSPHEDLIFMGNSSVIAPATADDTVSMLGAGLLMGGGALGTAGGLAALGAGSLLLGAAGGGGRDADTGGGDATGTGGGGDGGAGGGGTQPGAGPRLPTVNEKDVIVITGEDTPAIVISGTGEPGATVDVNIGDISLVTTPDDSGVWQVVFEDETFPEDGTYPVVVVVTQPDGTDVDLTGPEVVIDTTPPDLSFTEGTVSTGHVVNGDEHQSGVRIAGTSEPDAQITVTVDGVTRTDTVDSSGNWSVTFTPQEVPGGEVTRSVTATATDSFGNSANYADSVALDTIPDPIVIHSALVGGDGVVNELEAQGGVRVTGTSTPGNTLTLTYEDGVQTITTSVTVEPDGTWHVDYLPGEVRQGEYDVSLTATTSDAAGNIGRQTGGFHVDTVHFLQIDPAPLGEGNLINAAAADGGVTLRGTTQSGSVVEVRFGSVTRQVTSTDGTWSIPFQGSDFARDEYDATFSVTARDAAGNVSTAARDVRVDTVVAVAITGDIGQDGLINMVAREQGVTITGTTDAASNSVMVQVGGASQPATVDAFGNWQARFEAADLPQGQGDLSVVATATDAARNTISSAPRNVRYDTEVRDFAFVSTGAADDGVINGAEAQTSFIVTGQVEAGSRVIVTLDGVSREANVLSDGRWSAMFEAGSVRDGEYQTELFADATDAAGNTARLSQAVRVDTQLNLLELNGPVAGDNIINIVEANAGVMVTGRVEMPISGVARSTVEVEFGGVRYPATVAADGTWQVMIPSDGIARGTSTQELVVHARDAAGNAGFVTHVVSIDTDAPDHPRVESYTRDSSGIRSVSIAITEDHVALTELRADGALVPTNSTGFDIVPLGESLHHFGQVLPDGSHLVITATDQAGNQSGTFLAFDELSTSVIDLSAPLAAGLQIDTIDLIFAEDSTLSLTEAQILALSPDARSVTIRGREDDAVTLAGAQRDGSEVIEGRNYAVYTMGEARVIIDEEIRIY